MTGVMIVSVPIFFTVIAGVFVVINIYLSIRIMHELSKRGYPVNFLLMRLLIIKYVHQYKKITTTETGQTGELFRPWILSINGALVFAVMAIVTTVLSK